MIDDDFRLLRARMTAETDQIQAALDTAMRESIPPGLLMDALSRAAGGGGLSTHQAMGAIANVRETVARDRLACALAGCVGCTRWLADRGSPVPRRALRAQVRYLVNRARRLVAHALVRVAEVLVGAPKTADHRGNP